MSNIAEEFNELMCKLGESALVNAMYKADLTLEQKAAIIGEYWKWRNS